MAESSVPEQAAPSRRGAGLVAKARAHKMAATVIAVAGFLGSGASSASGPWTASET